MKGGSLHAGGWMGAALGLCACGSLNMGEPTLVVAEIPVDLYFFPPTTSDLGPWRVSGIYLDPAGDTVNVPVPGGGRTPGVVQQIFADNEGLSPRLVNRQARVLADGGDDVLLWSSPEVDGNAVLRTAAGNFDVWVEPHDTNLLPQWHRGTTLPATELSLVIPAGIKVTGLLQDTSGHPISGVRVAAFPMGTSNVALQWSDRGSGIATTSEDGAFSLQVPPGNWVLWSWSVDGSSVPLPATPVGRLTLGEVSPEPLTLTVTPPETYTYSFTVMDEELVKLTGVTVSIRRRPDPANAEFAGVYTDEVVEGEDGSLPAGSVGLNLPAGTFDLVLTPSALDADRFVPTRVEVQWAADAPSTDSFALDRRIDSLTGQIRAEGDVVVGVTAMLLPENDQLDTVSAVSDATGGLTFSGQMAEGDYTLLLIPPVDSTLGRLSQKVRLRQGQSAFDTLPELEVGQAWPCQLERLDPNLAGTVVKVVPAGLRTWQRTWGPGPDPRDVIGEAQVLETGSFTLYLPSTLSLPVGRLSDGDG